MPTKEDADRFESTQEHYARHRPGYGEVAVEHLRERFDLDGSARVLDLGCGAGQLAVPLAAHAGEVVGMDPNEGMLREARERAGAAGRENVEWIVGADSDLEDLRDELGTFRLTTMGRSFHWMDAEATLDRLYRMTEPGGGVALVTDGEWLTKGRREWQADAYEVADEYVDDLPERVDPGGVEYEDPWDELLAAHGFGDVETATFEFRREWDADGVVGYVLSLSFCSPKVLGDDLEAFEADLRADLDGRDGDVFVQDVTVEIVSGRK